MERALRILVDHRELSSGIPDLLRRRPGTVVVSARLEAGDYCIGDSVGIERKTAEDFAESVIDGRLFSQASALRRCYRRALIVLEGAMDRGIPKVPGPAVRGALVSVAVVFGVPILNSSGPEESAELILLAGKQIARGAEREEGYVRPGYRPKGWRRRALYVLQGLPNVGPKRAAALLAAFGSVGVTLAATEQELRSVPEIGMRVARGIRRCLGPEEAEDRLARDERNKKDGGEDRGTPLYFQR